jgi:hypothetical protein
MLNPSVDYLPVAVELKGMLENINSANEGFINLIRIFTVAYDISIRIKRLWITAVQRFNPFAIKRSELLFVLVVDAALNFVQLLAKPSAGFEVQ